MDIPKSHVVRRFLPRVSGRLLALSYVSVLLAGCIGVPAHMRIENTSHPKYEDEDVRFRTTHYFRVFDYCADNAAIKAPQVDTLYRFRMTGKANSLTTQVHFESGTLTASQIDPFGANVVYDERNKQYYFKSQSEAQQEGQRERKFEDLTRLLQVYRNLKPASPALVASAPSLVASSAVNNDDDKQLTDALRGVIEQRILSLKDAQAPAAAATAVAIGTRPSPDSETAKECRQARRGYQILGPQGWRTFNQDERLMLAMSSSARPLISTMQEISGRVLNNQPIEAEMLLPLVREDLRLSRAGRELDKFNGTNPERGATLLEAAIRQLSAVEVAK